MAERKQFSTGLVPDAEFAALWQASKAKPVTEDDLREQRISFAYGNALEADEITKDSVRHTSERIRLVD